ncbi:hypothetical protein HK104_002460 [Borealophlyctis nickersoniae]|nr:hypothetical protein HK104_002460 [Borealophlyctis nickersoniae]
MRFSARSQQGTCEPNRKKRMNQIKKQIARGIKDPDEDDPFELFVSSTNIRYTYYKETEKILGNTYGMCILQDFEALTPNLLARTIETVEGGGVVVLLLRTMSSLKQLYTMTMDVHSRYRTESHHDTVARFNERFILSLGSCDTCLVLDDELNVLPISTGRNVKALPRTEEAVLTPEEQELKELKESFKDTQPVGSLVATAKTLDQARAILTFVESIAEKTLRSTVSLTASRGRGKSAALGIAMAAAVAYGYSNIFITSPSPENLKTLFEFLFKGFDALGYEEHLDYDIVQSTNPAFQKAVVRVNFFRDHRQTIQWIQPSDHHVLAQAELLVIDEAAAIPLPLVKNLLGPYLVFMASTINGYEGTGRSLSLKLLQQLREQSALAGKSGMSQTGIVVNRDGKERKQPSGADTTAATPSSTSTARTLREIQLEVPIRYNPNDPVESWLNKLLCLDCCTPKAANKSAMLGCPHPSKCELYYVNRDTLFSYHPVSEAFLQKMMALYVASHYKNSPNDLQLLSDAPAHHLFVLLPPLDERTTNTLPEPLCVVQVCLEGSISKGAAMSSLARGVRSSGDLIPWVVTQQFQDDDFATLSGARVVRIATSPEYAGMGYGSRAVELLGKYYNGDIVGVGEETAGVQEEVMRVTDEELQDVTLATDDIRVRDPAAMPPLLLSLAERPPREHLHWVGVSYGLTPQLHKFWKRSGFVPVYVRQTPNNLTGEHTCIMLKTLDRSAGGDVEVRGGEWLNAFAWDFRRRFLELLGFQFRKFSPVVVLSILEAAGAGRVTARDEQVTGVGKPITNQSDVYRHFTPFDLKRLESYAQNMLDYHVVVDLVPTLSKAYFLNQLAATGLENGGNTAGTAGKEGGDGLAGVKLSPVQAAILAGVGLQKKTVEELEAELSLPVSQLLALFAKVVRKCTGYLSGVVERGVTDEVESSRSKKPKSKSGAKAETAGSNEESNKKGKKRDLEDEEAWDPTSVSLGDDLDEGGNEALAQFREKQRELVDSLNPAQYAIGGGEADWGSVQLNNGSNIVSVKNEHSSKKMKVESGKGVAVELAGKVRGVKTGVVDPKGVLQRVKSKKGKGGKK